jgi:putative tricarboxylic transport membrane protein
VPDTRAEVLADAVQQVVNSDEYRSFLQSAGFGPPDLPPDQFTAFLQRQDEQNGAVLTSEAFASVQSQQYGPWLFPSIVIGLLALTVVPLAWHGKLTVPAEAEDLTWQGMGRVGVAVASILFYLVAAETIGYVLTAALMLAVLFWRYRAQWQVAGAIIVILVPLTYQLFAIYLRVPLPWGWLGW